MRRVILSAVLVSIAFQGAARASECVALRSYARARAVLDRAVAAVGGDSVLRDLGTVRRRLTDDWVDVGQGRRPWRGSPPADRLLPHAGSAASPVESHLDYRGRRFLESIGWIDGPNDQAVRVEAAGQHEGFWTITYMSEKPYFHPFDDEELRGLRAQRFRRHPEGLLRMALDRAQTLEYSGTSKDGGNTQEVFSFVDPAGTRVFVYVDERTGLPTKTESLRDHPITGDTSSETLYSDYRQAGALRLPFEIVDRVAGVPARRQHIVSIEPDAAFPEGGLEPPREFVRVVEDPAEPMREEIGPGVYLIRGRYNVVFAEFRDHVMVLETPAGEQYARACLEIIRATTSKPITYAVASHFHSDHLAGVRTFVAEGITILTTPDAVETIERALASRRTLHPDALARRPRRATLEPVKTPRVFDDGTQRLELYDLGPAPHVDHILAAYFPRQRLLHVADLFDVLTPELVIAGVDTEAMRKRWRELGLDVDRLIPVHGVPVGRAEIDRAFAVRAKYAR